MYIIDGIAYAGEPCQTPEVATVEARRDGTLLVELDTGESRVYDVTPLLDFPVYAPLKDWDVFSQVVLDHGVVTWCDGALDIAPENILLHSVPVESHDQRAAS